MRHAVGRLIDRNQELSARSHFEAPVWVAWLDRKHPRGELSTWVSHQTLTNDRPTTRHWPDDWLAFLEPPVPGKTKYSQLLTCFLNHLSPSAWLPEPSCMCPALRMTSCSCPTLGNIRMMCPYCLWHQAHCLWQQAHIVTPSPYLLYNIYILFKSH